MQIGTFFNAFAIGVERGIGGFNFSIDKKHLLIKDLNNTI